MSRPNIVLILVDDADPKVLEHVASSRIKAAIAGNGATATRYLTTQPLCSPSRASILRGMYPQNTGVKGNGHAYAAFKNHGGETSNVAVWLQDSGYYTGLIGKYINGYTVDPSNLNPPPGWDYWFGVGKAAYASFDYDANDDGTLVHYGTRQQNPLNYLTDVLKEKSLAFLNSPVLDSPSAPPFLLVVTPMAPHSPSNPAPRHENLYSNEVYPKAAANPSFNEDDVTDKPWYIALLDKLEQPQIGIIDERFRQRLRCMESVADLVDAVIARLALIPGRLENTYIVFTSDNGFHMGEHRLGQDTYQDDAEETAPGGKNSMYEEDIRLPFWVRGPGITAETTVGELLGNVDLAPTFCEIAEVVVDPDIIDGRSFLQLLHGESIPWRTQYLISRGQTKSYAGIRSAEEWVFGELDAPAPTEMAGEYYNLDPDAGPDFGPYELTNLYPDLLPADLAALQARVAAYRACAGDSCRIFDST